MCWLQVHGDWEQLQVLSYSNSAGIRAPQPPVYPPDILSSHDSVTSVPYPRRASSGPDSLHASPGASKRPRKFSRLACFGVGRCSSPETYRRTSASELTALNLRLHEHGSSGGRSSSGPATDDVVGELSSVEAATQAQSIASSDWSFSSISTTFSERAGQLLRGPPSILSCIMESEPAGFMDSGEQMQQLPHARCANAVIICANNIQTTHWTSNFTGQRWLWMVLTCVV